MIMSTPVKRTSGDLTRPLPSWARRVCATVRLGDKVAVVATPVARVIRAKCIDPETKQLRPDSKCAGRKRRLNGE